MLRYGHSYVYRTKLNSDISWDKEISRGRICVIVAIKKKAKIKPHSLLPVKKLPST